MAGVVRDEGEYGQHLFSSTMDNWVRKINIYQDGNCKKIYIFGKERMIKHNEYKGFGDFKGVAIP